MHKPALIHLRKTDPVMKRVIDKIGPCELIPQERRTPFESLARAIAHQQLNGTAAQTILGRFIKLFPSRRFPKPHDLASVSDEAIRAAGFSRAKIAAIRDLAEKSISGVVPSARVIKSMSNEDIIERLTQVRGIGQWTVEMLLIFQLGREDVLPADDFGVRRGFMLAYKLPDMPKPKELLAHGQRWAPHRTVASWYLWRVADGVAKL